MPTMAIGPAPISAKLKVKTLLSDEPTAKESTISLLHVRQGGLDQFRSLRSDENLVLFTPALWPLQRAAGSRDDAMDPFEPLGRALNKYHSRIQHVPFVPSSGITDTHCVFLEQASAAIIVLCDDGGTSESSSASLREFFSKQATFAEDIHRRAESLYNTNARTVPILLILITKNEHLKDGALDVSAFHAALHCSQYEQEVLSRAAGVIFESTIAETPSASITKD